MINSSQVPSWEIPFSTVIPALGECHSALVRSLSCGLNHLCTRDILTCYEESVLGPGVGCDQMCHLQKEQVHVTENVTSGE